MKLKPVGPVVKPPIIDRLTFILPFKEHSYRDQESWLAPIRKKIESAIKGARCEKAYLSGARYKESFRVLLTGGAKVLVQIGAVQPDRQKGNIRIDLNPAKFADGDVEQFNRTMRRIIGPEYDDVMKRPLINRIDIAVDVYNLCLNNVLFHYTNVQRFNMIYKRYDGHGHIEGYNIGSHTSAYMDAVYNKGIERVHAAVMEIAKKGICEEKLIANCITQLKRLKGDPEVVRIEIRGKKMRGIPLHKIVMLSNRFERFSFVDLTASGGSELSPYVQRSFHALCRQDGWKAAMAAFKHTEHARAVHKYWRNRKASWWKPEPMWQQGYEALRNIGLFPDEAFDDVTQ